MIMRKKTSKEGGVNRNELLPEHIDSIPEEENGLAVHYSCHMHPITQLAIPDFMDQDRNSMVDTTCSILYGMLPMLLNFLLNSASGVVNIYFVGMEGNEEIFCQVCLGTVIANILVYYLIEYMGAGFAIVCSYFSRNEREEVGFMYQKTLGVTFLICVVMTPVIYLSDKIMRVLGFESALADGACTYAWALVPSFYLYSFLDTNKNYLQSQGVIFAPILIHLCTVILHVLICVVSIYRMGMGMLAAAWAKNISESVCCLALYLFIVIRQPTQESWVQWSLKSTNNISRFIQEVISHEAFTYLQAISFQLLCVVACRLESAQLSAHFSFAWVYVLIYLCFQSLSECLKKTIAFSIEQNEVLICKKKISLGILLNLLLSFVIVVNIVQHRLQFTQIFVEDEAVQGEMERAMVMFEGVVFVSGLNITLAGIAKALEIHQRSKIWLGCYYLIGIVFSAVLCYVYEYGVTGLWLGWLSCLGMSMLMNLKLIVCLNFEEAFGRVREKYKTMEAEVRVSRQEMTSDKN